MPRPPRGSIIDPHAVQVLHCVSRCVRRAYLCGEDAYSGKNYDHRRQWIEDRQIDLLKYFSLDLIAVSIMSNHMHHVIRTRPDKVKKMSNREVARRWLGICPKRRNDDGTASPPTDKEIRDLCKEKNKMKKLRKRLASISWFMSRLKHAIACAANREDRVDGRFWAGRFRATLLESEESVLTCSVYVDLNPERAGMADCPEDAYYTSLYHRIVAYKARKKQATGKRRPGDTDADRWLAPYYPDQLPAGQDYAEQGHRASDDAGLSVTIEQYMELVDWTGRQIKEGKRGRIPPELAPMLERLQIDTGLWIDAVESFGEWSKIVAANATRMASKATELGRRFLHGVAKCREFFPG